MRLSLGAPLVALTCLLATSALPKAERRLIDSKESLYNEITSTGRIPCFLFLACRGSPRLAPGEVACLEEPAGREQWREQA